MSRGLAVVLMLGLVGCDEGRRPGGTAPPTTRRDAGAADVAEGASDAAEGELDALAGAPDATPGAPDATPGAPDAQPGALDATPRPDAVAFADALVFADAAPAADAQPPFDSGVPDAGVAVPGSIGEIRTGIIPFGANVALTDVVVTAFHDEATRQDTLWVQDPRGGTSNAGVKVYVRGTHNAVVGARVDVTGVVTDYFGETEINNAAVVTRGTFATLTPVPVSVLTAMDEAYEGMLVRLVDVVSTTPGYICSQDDAMCLDARLWEVNGPGGVLVYDFVYVGSEWEARTGVVSVSGVMMWRYNRRRIMPRSDADLPF